MQNRTRIKMCGTTNLNDAKAAVDCGVDGLGFIFFQKSPRNVIPDTAKEIIRKLPPFVDLVGVFVDEDLTEVEEIVHYCGLNHVQLHGKESVEYCDALRKKLPTCKIIKAFRIGERADDSTFAPYNDVVDGILLDTYAKGQEGGTGHTFPWTVLDDIEFKLPIILAGGLTPDNVKDAVQQVAPFAIDINSGVELEPGKKDHAALELLIKRVREVEIAK